MSARRLCWITAAFMAALTLAACGSTRSAQTSAAPQAASSQRAASQDPASQDPASQDTADAASDLEALYWARQDSARKAFTKADVRFMTGMIKHHAQALTISHLVPTHGASERVRTLAARIINSQEAEIGWMQEWLRKRGQPTLDIDMEGTKLTVNGTSVHGMDMAGILTQRQIQTLDDARGAPFDRLFLTYMIEHHSGALEMVNNLFAADGAAQNAATFKLASEIHAGQKTEIARMKRLRRSLPGAPGS